MEKILLTLKDKSAYTLMELLVILVLIGILSGAIASKYIRTQSDYELVADAHELRSNLRLAQAYSTRYYEQQNYFNWEMRDDDLWGITFPSKNSYQMIRKEYLSSQKKISEMLDPVYYDKDIYPSHEKKIVYQLSNPCMGGSEIFFNALGKPVNLAGKPCDRDIVIILTEEGAKRSIKIVINKTGHINIDYQKK
ncbi:MAG: prepilin-type N-terminal cleavage/methylation domain-containing protein [Candidatus Magnetomorum sp.]|nr:prepilin-type N-terminal cleavage/methylation domain-containing protein [Candidatus Magnetomorum sp.]